MPGETYPPGAAPLCSVHGSRFVPQCSYIDSATTTGSVQSIENEKEERKTEAKRSTRSLKVQDFHEKGTFFGGDNPEFGRSRGGGVP